MKWYASWGHDEFILCLGYKGEMHQGVLPQLQRGALQRLRALERRHATSSCSGATSRDWTDHVRRHGRPVDHRRAAARGRAAPRRRRVLPRDLWRRSHGCAARGHDRAPARRRARRRCSCPCARSSTPTWSRPTTDGVVRSIEDLQQADVWINGGFFVFRREILDDIEPGEELVVEPFRRLIERERADRVPLRGLLGADGHDQGQAAARRLRGVGPRPVAQRRQLVRERRRLVLQLSLLGRAAAPPRARCSARTRTTSRSAAARRCSRSPRAVPSSRSPGSCSARAGQREREARASAEAFLAASAARRRRRPRRSATASSRTSAAT